MRLRVASAGAAVLLLLCGDAALCFTVQIVKHIGVSEFCYGSTRFARIDSGQCTGYISELCPSSGVLGLSVNIRDKLASDYPQVEVSADLQTVRLYRAAIVTGTNATMCIGEMLVDVKFKCGDSSMLHSVIQVMPFSEDRKTLPPLGA